MRFRQGMNIGVFGGVGVALLVKMCNAVLIH